MGFISRIFRCFCCEAAVELYTPNERNHKHLIASRHTPANDVPFLSSSSSEECANTISSALSSPNCLPYDGDSRTTELLNDLQYGVNTIPYALSSTNCLHADDDPRISELLYDLRYGVDTSSHAFNPPAIDLQEYRKYDLSASDAFQQNDLSSQASFLWHEDCNMQQIVLTRSSRSSSIDLIDTDTSIDNKEFEEQNKQGSHLLFVGDGGEHNESAKSWGNFVASVFKGEVVEERWIKHYSSCQRILLVGDGDFSFSASLAKAFGSASNMVATSLDSGEFLALNYHRAITNIQVLESRGCRVIHGIDCTKMAKNLSLKGLTFDRIVYNFPFAGFFKNRSREAQLRLHQKLVSKFMENAKKMMSKEGEIHITHKSNGFHREWNLEHLAVVQGLRLIKAVHFNYVEYPGYRTKTGFGGDANFNSNPSNTYMFALSNC